jgi:uncharacterized protein (DUF1697 family)
VGAARRRPRALVAAEALNRPVPGPDRGGTRTYVAFIRAVMHGRNGLHRATLLDLFAAAGAEHARSYLTTGNVSFVARPAARVRIVSELEEGLEAVVGRRTEVIVRSVEELLALRDLDPFATAPLTVEHERIVSFFVDAVPEVELPLWSPSRDFVVFGTGPRELFSVAVKRDDGTSRGSGGLIERATGARVTSRAWSTVERVIGALT